MASYVLREAERSKTQVRGSKNSSLQESTDRWGGVACEPAGDGLEGEAGPSSELLPVRASREEGAGGRCCSVRGGEGKELSGAHLPA